MDLGHAFEPFCSITPYNRKIEKLKEGCFCYVVQIQNIAPVEIEDLVKPHPLIGQVCVVGDGKKFLSALIVLDGDGGAETWASENGIEYSLKEMAKNEKVIQAVQEQVDEANSQVANVQGIKKFVILDKEWTDSSGELTPTLKLKRNVIAEMYNDEIESMYEGIE